MEGQPGLLTYPLGDAVDICLLVDEKGLLAGIANIPYFEVTSDLPSGLTDVTWGKLLRKAIAATRSAEVSQLSLVTQRGVSLGYRRDR